jgi:esterase/lipase superfamily enzyme
MANNFVVRGISSLERGQFVELLRRDRRDTALVFVHGYRNSFDDGAFRLAQIVWDGGLWSSVPVLFSWPSKNDAREYLYDGESADYSVSYFIHLLEILQKEAEIKTIHIIAHSMGNRIVLNAINQAVAKLQSRPLGELIMAAADVDRDKFKQVVEAVRGVSHGMTLYASAADSALWWSGKLASDIRAGTVTKDGPIVVEGVESIDMTSTNPSESYLEKLWRSDPLGLNTHNTFVSPVIVDIARLVTKGEHPPPSRTALIRGVPEDIPRYWRYAD